MPAEVDAVVKVCPPTPTVTKNEVKDDLTYEGYDYVNQKNQVVKDYKIMRDGSIVVPRAYGCILVNRLGLDVEDLRESGTPIGKLKKVKLRDYQIEPVDSLVRLSQKAWDFRFEAYTGSGKTVMACEFARRLGTTTLILVDQNFLMNQWIDTLTNLFDCPPDKIGIVQGKKCEVEGKWFVVAMIQTLFRRMPDQVVSFAGTLIVDEAHVIGAEVFSTVLWKIPARIRLGVSATPDRQDVFDNVIRDHLGDVKYKLQKTHKKSEVRYVETEFIPTWYASISPKAGRYLTEMSHSAERNYLIANVIKWLHDSGRNILAVSERVEHLSHMKSLCIALGIPECDIGIVAGYENMFAYEKDTRPKRKPQYYEKGTEYTPVTLSFIKKRIPRKVLEQRKENSRIILATYGMFEKGVDVPHLDSGVDMTPRSKAQQLHGRILRDKEDKLTPLWVTIRDKMSYRAEYQFIKRLEEYERSNAEVYLWKPKIGVKKMGIKKLKGELKKRCALIKEFRITAVDGRNILETENP